MNSEDCPGCKDKVQIVINGTEWQIDKCISEIVEALNDHPNIRTASSCCGHGQGKASFIAMVNEQYVFFEIDLHTPLDTWNNYRPKHEKMIGENSDSTISK